MDTLQKYAEAVRSGRFSQMGELPDEALHATVGPTNVAFIPKEPSAPLLKNFDWKFWLLTLPAFLISLALLIWALTTKTPHQDLKDAKQVLTNPVKVAKESMIDLAFRAGLALEFDCKRVVKLENGGKAGIFCSYKGTRDLANEGLRLSTMN